MSILQRLMLISGSFLLPISVLLYFTVDGIQDRITFASQEKDGVALEKAIQKCLKSILLHRSAANRVLAGDKSASSITSREEGNLETALRNLETAEKSLGNSLQFTQEGLGKRKRDDARTENLQKKWEQLRKSWNTMAVDKLNAEYEQMIKIARLMITHLGDTSNMILDPDLDSYYLVDVALVALPQTQERISDILYLYSSIMQDGEAKAQEKQKLSVQIALFKEADIDRVVASAETSVNEDSNFYGKSESLFRNLPAAVDKLRKTSETFSKMIQDLKIGTQTKSVDQKIIEAGNMALEESFNLFDTSANELEILLDNRIAKFRSDRNYSLLLSTLALAVSFGLVWYIGKGITVPIRESCNRLEQLASGDLGTPVQLLGQGELGAMSDSLAKAVKGMQQAIQLISGNSRKLIGSSAQQKEVSRTMVANASETSSQASAIAAGAEEVSANIKTVAAAAEEMGATIREIARQAQQAAQVANEAVTIAETGNMAVLRLGENSSIIGNVVKVITSIAEQTNLLALNASIEAARAGEFGKGFAVVASEVKELAKETAKATEDIRAKIQGIQVDTQEAVAANEKTRGIISKIHEIQNTIAGAVEEQAATTREITRNVADAASGSGEIARNITGLAEAAKSTSQGAAELDRAASDLDLMASELEQMVKKFSI